MQNTIHEPKDVGIVRIVPDVLETKDYLHCESGTQFDILISEPIPSVYKWMQPKLHKIYRATLRGGECGRNDRGKRYFVIYLKNRKPLIVYPEECCVIQRCLDAS